MCCLRVWREHATAVWRVTTFTRVRGREWKERYPRYLGTSGYCWARGRWARACGYPYESSQSQRSEAGLGYISTSVAMQLLCAVSCVQCCVLCLQ